MDQETKDNVLVKLTKAQNILIAVSKEHGFDGLASGLALCLSLEKLGKNASVSAPYPTVGDAQSLYGVDKVGKPGGQKNLVVVVENAVENVDNVTYFLEGDKLKIIVHPLPGSQGTLPKEISIEQSSVNPDIIFAIGFKSLEDLSREITLEQKLDPNTFVINISTIDSNQKFAQLNIINPQASGVSELVGELMGDLSLALDEDIAFNLYCGLSFSTDSFSPAKTTPTVFQVAAWLLKFGAGRASLAQAKKPDLSRIISSVTQKSTTGNLHIKNYQVSEAPTFQKPIEEVEIEPKNEDDWLKPPKIYKGAKSFDREN